MYGWQELDAAWSAAVTDEGYLMVGDSVGIPCPDSLNVGSYYRQEGPSGEEGVVQTIEYYVRYDTRISNFTGPFIDFDAITAEVFANNSFLPVLLACDDGKKGAVGKITIVRPTCSRTRRPRFTSGSRSQTVPRGGRQSRQRPRPHPGRRYRRLPRMLRQLLPRPLPR
uniref:Uncharacterized protein n=1 Tax=Pseudictyota dubia TaxID=2749911 RepID=A0A7R9WDX9_9STRA|mmetsp:Transcript_46387/g.86205  ORF Transcript_46387/g.86205 Transcript_46387/m.86205 type:complete len:168 (+) Transcript_46387:517-1020(+)